MPPNIIFQDVSLGFGSNTVASNISFEIPAGSFFSIVGPSGVGKTTLLRGLAGLVAPSAGRILTSDGSPLSERIAFMAQEDLLLPWLDVENNVFLGAKLRGEYPDRTRARVLVGAVGLADRSRCRPQELSGGMRQRVALARTLYEDRPVVLMDEPFSALDYITKLSMQALAARLLRGKTTILVTHDVSEACRLSSHIYVFSPTVSQSDRVQKLEGAHPRSPTDPVVAVYERSILSLLGVSQNG